MVTNEMSFQLLHKVVSDLAFQMGVGRLFHQLGMVKENFVKSEFMCLS